ncbi:PHP domain-containing protein [Candidatus Acetothermia bacterium]|nr:PHP domain-containing protein [Candidatus Acetothermia bacterium]
MNQARNRGRSYADLHLHTRASDGTLSVTDMVARAREHNLTTIAITDHDTIAPQLHTRLTSIDRVEVITGIEIKADIHGYHGEILGYFIDPHNEQLRRIIHSLTVARISRMEEMVMLCRRRVGKRISFDEVRSCAAGTIGRLHLAHILKEKGIVASTAEAFERLIGRGKPCYVPLARPSFADVVAAIQVADGLTSLAHPCLIQINDWENLLPILKEEGLDGVEVFYPYLNSSQQLGTAPEDLVRLAKRYGFLLTGGSDDHGPGSVRESIGVVKLPMKDVDALRRAARL